jgi:hypothetical protein
VGKDTTKEGKKKKTAVAVNEAVRVVVFDL